MQRTAIAVLIDARCCERSGRHARMRGSFFLTKNFLRARRDCCGAYGPLAPLTLGSPCGRPNRLRRFVELALLSVGGSNYHQFAVCYG
jgi:hypothetical protein